jgi:bifunctional DNA-binding transcriptional regulator/antitoxin component of YhaV-PrlF toxin-antitoxin module
MSDPNTVRRKYTEELRRHLELAGGEPLEVIVRIKDPKALMRAQSMAGHRPDEIAEREREYTRSLLDNMVEFVHSLERQGAPVRLLDTSWLTHSVLARATPAIVRKLAERDEVDLVDLNADARIVPAW